MHLMVVINYLRLGILIDFTLAWRLEGLLEPNKRKLELVIDNGEGVRLH
jgi:hypothetical protein